MQSTSAHSLIGGVPVDASHPNTWADLGCGDGLFTKTLAGLLADGSRVYGVDKTAQTLPPSPRIPLHFLQLDFEKQDLALSGLDGILMANSLHYVSAKAALLEKLRRYLKEDGQFLIVEYDTMLANPYVPYPLDYTHLTALFQAAGFKNVEKLGERPSLFGKANLYAASIR
jgi:ubiquinone/menaquinone biosynthesis C-methylase UbiE